MQADFIVRVLALEANRIVELIDKERVDPAGGVVTRGPDNAAGGVGDLGRGAVGIVVIIMDFLLIVKGRQGNEGSGIKQVFAYASGAVFVG